MPDSTVVHGEIMISELPVATTTSATDQLEANQAGTSRSITLSQIVNLAVEAVGAAGMADGTVLLPGLPFTLDLDTGFYRPATNQLAIALGGVNFLTAFPPDGLPSGGGPADTGMVLAAPIATTTSLTATGSGFANQFIVNVTSGVGAADIGGNTFNYTATSANDLAQMRNTAFATFVNTVPGSVSALAVAVDAFISLGPTGGAATGSLTAAVVHRAHYSSKSTNGSEITTGYTYWAAGVDVNDPGATGTVKTNVAFQVADQGDTSRTGATRSKVYRDTYGMRINDFSEGAQTSVGIEILMNAPSLSTSTAVTTTSASRTITIGGTLSQATGAACSITGPVLTVSGAVTGTWAPGQIVTGTGVTASSTIIRQLSGTTGAAGTYLMTQSSTVAGPVALAGAAPFYPGQTISGTPFSADTHIESQSSGTPGGAGTYLIDRDALTTGTVAAAAQVSKFGIRQVGNASNILGGPLRIGDPTSPQTEVLDGRYAPGPLPAGSKTISQLVTVYTEADAVGTSFPTNFLNRIIASASNSQSQIICGQNEITLSNTGGTVAATYGQFNYIDTSAAGAVTLSNVRVTVSHFKAGGAATVTNLYLLAANDPNYGAGAGTIGTAVGLFTGNVGHASKVQNAYGVLIADITASLTKTAGIFSSMASGTSKYFIRSEGTATSTHRGDMMIGASAAPTVTLEIGGTGTFKTAGLATLASATITGALTTTSSVTMGTYNYAADAGSTDDYVVTYNPALAAYLGGGTYKFRANTANTGAATININGLGAKTIVKAVSTALVNNDILAGMVCVVIYDGANMVLQNPRTL